MSDGFSPCCWRFKDAIIFTQPEERYEARKKEKRVLSTLEIPYPLLKEWHEIVREKNVLLRDMSGQEFSTGCANSPSTCTSTSEDSPTAKRFSYVDLVKKCTFGQCFAFSDDENVRRGIDVALLNIAYKISLDYKKTKGWARQELNNRVQKFHVMEGQTKSVNELYREIETIQNELLEWKKAYENLELEKERIYEEMVLAVNQRGNETQVLQKTNKELEDYIASLENSVGISSYQGKPLSTVKNKFRTLRTFISRAEAALWFCSSFGVELVGLRDAFYHEISIVTDGPPRSYLVKQCRDELNKMCQIEPLNAKFEGAKVNSVETVFKVHISDFLKQNSDFDPITDKIKINGDGATMKRNSNFILLLFSILQTEESVMSAKRNRTLGIVNGAESYHTIKESFQSLFNEVNDLIATSKMTVDGHEIKTEFYLGGDYKFILVMLGLKGATSNYACAWCKVHKTDRWRINNDYNSYNTLPMARTQKEICEMSKKSKDNYCCDKQPLLNIPLYHIVVDELHLMLRVTDILIENLVHECLNWDKDDDLDHKKGTATGLHLKSLIIVIKSCGVSFDVWEKRNADGKGSGKHDWTSLLGKDKKILLADLPNKLHKILHPDTALTVVAVWTEFAEIYKVVNDWNPEKDPTEFFMKANERISPFVSLNGKREGYERARVTPYMHIMVAHIPKFFELHKSVKIFTGQGVEKNNDVARAIILRKSNKWDSAGDVLQQEQRQWELKENERQVRCYTKRKKATGML
ncbi:hypothetical protein AWC38_SpisGene23165 [Stylophora pistillata]|uniref:Uncharacterized protein n=1 Tax=Stylophora pistillata TaxID=50429 RepID=A0A2B4R7L4_STYPI|nr:hypothetical protein AWC38_SpisGene23165 [Stylophora pistillata]